MQARRKGAAPLDGLLGAHAVSIPSPSPGDVRAGATAPGWCFSREVAVTHGHVGLSPNLWH